MNLTDFPERTLLIGAGQEQYQPLPAYRYQQDPCGRVVFCWKPTFRERVIILLTGRIWQQVLTFNQPFQPTKLEVEKPEMPPHL